MAKTDKLPLVTIRNAEILPGGWRNFSGVDKFNDGGKRTFNIKLPEDVALAMQKDGFNIKELKPRDEDDPEDVGYRVEVTTSYENRPPQIWLVSGGHRTLLDEGSVNILDYADIAKADVIINPYVWEVNGKGGVKAYLHKLFVTLKEDELDLEYADVPVSGASQHNDGPRFEED